MRCSSSSRGRTGVDISAPTQVNTLQQTAPGRMGQATCNHRL